MKAHLTVLLVCVCAVLESVRAVVSSADESIKKNFVDSDNEAVDEMQKADRKGDLVAQTSYEHPHYYGGGGEYGGYGGGHHGGHDHHHHVEHHGDGYGYGYDPFKYLLVPLAGVALLGAAALFVSNPLLLTLGVVGQGRKKRSLPGQVEYNQELLEKLNKLHLLEKFIEQFPKDQIERQEKKLLANYLHCSGAADNLNNMCLERLTCEIENPNANVTNLEKDVFKIIKSDIMENELITDDLKYRLDEAKKVGYKRGDCRRYLCREVDLSRFAQ